VEAIVYTVAQAARLLGVSARTYYAAASRGEVPATRIGRRLVVSSSALARLLDGEVVPMAIARSGDDETPGRSDAEVS
jgi:excisionase family DNA binding protein